MTRADIISRFREENPEITANVISDAVLRSWCVVADKEICARARLIVDTDDFTCTINEPRYDLTALLTKYFDSDEYPGGGLSIEISSSSEKRLLRKTKAELDNEISNWRTQSSNTPKYYYRRGKYVYLHPAPSSALVVNVDFVAISDDFNSDNITPYNQRLDLEPFHYGIVQYLRWRAKSKVGKPEEAKTAMDEYMAFVAWIVKSVGGGKYGPISLVPQGITPYRGDRA